MSDSTRSIRRNVRWFGIAYLLLGFGCVALALAKPKHPFPDYIRVSLVVAAPMLVIAALGAFTRQRWTWRLALVLQLAMLVGGIALTVNQALELKESESTTWLLVRRGCAVVLYSSFALFWLRRDVHAYLATGALAPASGETEDPTR